MNTLIRNIPTYSFSLYTKLPKKYQPKQPSSWMQRLFSQTQNTPGYALLQELFDYLQNSQLFAREFPFLQNTERISQNNMLTHVCLLRNRIAVESQVSRSQVLKFNYNLQNTFFPTYAGIVNPHIPTTYMNKLQIFDQQIKQYQFAISSTRSLQPSQYAPLFKKLVYENRLDFQNYELIKYCKYYYAHKKYLNKLSWNDMGTYKVKWGFQEGKLIAQVQKP